MKLYIATLFLALFAFANQAHAEDGRYDAIVKTDSGSYRVPVEVENGKVTRVHWPDGGNMHVRGAELDGSEAIGRNYDGDRIKVEIDDSSYSEHADDANEDNEE